MSAKLGRLFSRIPWSAVIAYNFFGGLATNDKAEALGGSGTDAGPLTRAAKPPGHFHGTALNAVAVLWAPGFWTNCGTRGS